MQTRVMVILAAVGCFCAGGCMTKSLWSERDYVVPSPVPNLSLSQTPRGILVQYDAEYERNGDIHRRAYLLEANMQRIAAGQKPAFVNPAKAGPQTPIPICVSRIASQHQFGLVAVCSTNFCTFSIYRGGKILGPCDLPVFKDREETVEQVALTPLTVAGDATVVGGCVWAVLRAEGLAVDPVSY